MERQVKLDDFILFIPICFVAKFLTYLSEIIGAVFRPRDIARLRENLASAELRITCLRSENAQLNTRLLALRPGRLRPSAP